MPALVAMNMTRLFGGGTLAALAVSSLLGCSTAPTQQALPVPPYEDLVAMAGEFSANGNDRAALELYRQAAASQPARKEPWQHIARMSLAAGRPGVALVAAEEVLHRDPADELASQVYIASALEVARDAMRRLHASGTTPGEHGLAHARQLVSIMGLVFGDEKLLGEELSARIARRAGRRGLDARPCTMPPVEAPLKARPDPLEALGGD